MEVDDEEAESDGDEAAYDEPPNRNCRLLALPPLLIEAWCGLLLLSNGDEEAPATPDNPTEPDKEKGGADDEIMGEKPNMG